MYTVLREAEYRSLAPIPWWKIPFVEEVVPQQKSVKQALIVINQTLDRLVQSVQEMLNEEDEELDTSQMSILHFLLASGEVVSAQQLRDDLMTLLIAGHETTATAISWALYWVHKQPEILEKLLAELDGLGDSPEPMKLPDGPKTPSSR